MVLGDAGGPRLRPDGDHVYLDVRHLGAEQLEAKLPDITEFARTYLGVEPVTEPIPSSRPATT